MFFDEYKKSMNEIRQESFFDDFYETISDRNREIFSLVQELDNPNELLIKIGRYDYDNLKEKYNELKEENKELKKANKELKNSDNSKVAKSLRSIKSKFK